MENLTVEYETDLHPFIEKALYLSLCDEMDEIFDNSGFRHTCTLCSTNMTFVKEWKRYFDKHLRKEYYYYYNEKGCCVGCEYLSENGCTIQNLWCKIWTCELIGSITRNKNYMSYQRPKYSTYNDQVFFKDRHREINEIMEFRRWDRGRRKIY